MNERQNEIDTHLLSLLRLLFLSERLTEARLCRAFKEVGYSAAHWRVLSQLVPADAPLSLGALAERLGFVKSNVTQLIDRMEAEGLVSRLPDPSDRRAVLAQVTEEGLRRYRAGMQTLQVVEQELLEEFTQQERVQLLDLLERLTTRWA
ncbi:MAG TPA: MarR family transcriptional regulator [Ktedonobacteraceae bacterium]|nr:MarR family transcriptional regulator [Ktedonobacteraceae bacterium]